MTLIQVVIGCETQRDARLVSLAINKAVRDGVAVIKLPAGVSISGAHVSVLYPDRKHRLPATRKYRWKLAH